MEIAWSAFALVAPNLNNLFEAPTIFCVGTAVAIAAGESGAILVSLGWAFVASRVPHSAIQPGMNRVVWRVRASAASWLVLIANWVVPGVGLAKSARSSVAAAG